MKCISTHSLLYIQTAFSTNVETYIQYEHYAIHLPCTPEKTLHYLLELHQKSYHNQCMLSKNILNIKKFIPIYINEETILFPVTQKRAPIKYFINARNIIGIHSSIHTTMIVFEDGTTIELNIPYTLVTKKWQESLTVGHIIENYLLLNLYSKSFLVNNAVVCLIAYKLAIIIIIATIKTVNITKTDKSIFGLI